MPSVEVGHSIPEWSLDVTTTLVIAGAFATRDFQPLHHDSNAAIEQGLPAIAMNLYTSIAFIVRYVTDWSGPEVRVRAAGVRRVGVPLHPGDHAVYRGKVSEITPDEKGGRTLDVDVT